MDSTRLTGGFPRLTGGFHLIISYGYLPEEALSPLPAEVMHSTKCDNSLRGHKYRPRKLNYFICTPLRFHLMFVFPQSE